MDSFIVRIYRYEKNRPQRLMGIVEKVGVDGKRAFTQYDELWEILNPPAGKDVFIEEHKIRRRKKPGKR